MRKFGFLAGAALWMIAQPGQAAPVVTHNTTGSSGSWLHEFVIDNTLGGTNDIYFFGVQMPNGVEVSAPSGFDSNAWPTWGYNTSYGGSATLYNNVWIGGAITPGSTGSFFVNEASVSAQSDVPWFTFASGGTYNGGDNFNSSGNPGFEGVTSSVTGAVPEPSTWAMMLLGFGFVGGAMRSAKRRKKLTVSYA